MNLFAWILFGAIAGIIANVVDPHPSSGGLLGAIILGILGALVGGFIANIVFGLTISGFNLTSFIIAILGSLLLLLLGRSLREI